MAVHSPVGKILLVFAIALAYFLTAKLGFLLTVPPGNVTPLWPPSGIAVAAVFVLGRYCLPGVMLGSFAVNAITMSGDNALLVTFAIACGSTIQAGLTAFALHRYLPYTQIEKKSEFPTPDSAQSVIVFVVLAGLWATTAPTVGVTALTLGGYITLELYMSVWWTWWLGDYAGILTIAPMLMVIALKLNRYPIAEVTLFPLSTFWFGLSLIVFFVVFQLERRETDAKLHTAAQNIQQRLETYVRATQLNLLALSGFFSANKTVTSQQFSSFVAPLLKDNVEIIGLHWVSYVPSTQLSNWLAYEGKLSNIDTLYEIGSVDHLPRPVTARADYFPIVLLEPKVLQFRLEGLDLGSEPMRRATLERARDNKSFTVSPPLPPYHDYGNQPGNLLVVPVYQSDIPSENIQQRRAAIKGFAVALVNASNIAKAVTPVESLLATQIRISTISPGSTPELIYETPKENNGTTTGRLVEETRDITVGDQVWRLHVRSYEPFFSTLTWRSWVLLLFGIAMSSIVTAYINIRRKADQQLRDSEKFSRALFEATPDAGFVVNQRGQILRTNAAAGALFGYSTEELRHQTTENLIDPTRRKNLTDIREAFFLNPTPRFVLPDQPINAVHKDGRRFPIEVVLSQIRSAGEMLAIVIFRDVTEREQYLHGIHELNETLEQRVHERTSELEDAQHELTEMVSSLEQKNHEISVLSELSEYLDSSASIEEVEITLQQFLPHMFSGTRGQVFLLNEHNDLLQPSVNWGEPVLNANDVKPEDCWAIKRHRAYIWTTATMLRCPHCSDETEAAYICAPIVRQNNVLGLLHIRPPEALRAKWESFSRTALGVAEQLGLILTNLKLRESLQQQALRDVLTGLFNRRFLDESLLREISRSKRNHELLTVALIDIDFFKNFNDKFGHSAGDAVLIHVAQKMRDTVRTSDIVGRFGGEEFMILLPDTERRGAEQRLELIRESVAGLRISHHGVPLPPVTISIGAAFYQSVGEETLTTDALIEMADKALYVSKQNGRNRLTVYGNENVIDLDKHLRKE